MARIGTDIYLDATQALQTLGEAREILSPEENNRLLRLVLVDVGRKTKTVIKETVVKDYEVKQNWVADKVGFPEVEDGKGLKVVVPVRGARGSIGMVYPIYGRRKMKRRLRARIVKSDITVLPEKMEHQGGNPPFVADNVMYTRRTKKSHPIVRVVALGVPQMPINRSQEEIEKQLIGHMEESATRHFGRLFGG